jgi:hypothetical protein
MSNGESSSSEWFSSAVMRERPLALSVFGVLNLCFGTFGVVAGLIDLLTFTALRAGDAVNPIAEVVAAQPVYGTHLRMLILAGLVLAAVLLPAGLGLLRCQPWARAMSIAWSLLQIAYALLAMTINHKYLWPVIRSILLDHVGGQPWAAEEAERLTLAASGLVGRGIGPIYPLILLVFMLHPRVARALRAHDPCSPDRA